MSIRSIIVLLVAFIAMVSCSGDEKPSKRKVPEGVLAKDSMAYYLAEIHVVDATMRNREVRKRGLQTQAKQAIDRYFDTASVSEQTFRKSLNFWKDDFDDMEEIYDLSMEILSTKLAKIKLKEENEALEEQTETETTKEQ